jgi:hypothetical protein
MATESKTSSGNATARPAEPKKEPRKLADDFKANEPSSKAGLDAEGKPDGTLSTKQLTRAASEGMLSLRPQPSQTEMRVVLDMLVEKDEKGQPKYKVKTAKEGAEKAVSLL